MSAALPEFFDRSARLWPDAVAIDVPPAEGRPERTAVTYKDLQRRADTAARVFRQALPHGGIVAILLPRTTVHLYATQLAVLKAGCAYLCIEPSFPDDQVGYILRDSAAAVLVTDESGHERATRAGYQGAVVRVDCPTDTSGWPLDASAMPEGLAYVIYTSGTTGRPKGVLIGHSGVANLIGADVAEFALAPGDRVAQGSSAAYDSSVEETWMAFSTGATVVVMDDETVRLGPDLVGWLRRERITALCPPPTLLRAASCDDPQAELPDLRLLYVGGEALPDDVAERWSRGRRMVNGYGPTECTVTCLRADIVPGQSIAIGKPVPGMQAWVLDENLLPVAPGTHGELCMSGAGLAIGYHNQPELTATKFPQHPTLGRIYRTGDLVHAEPDGTLYYHGRIDSQVKLRGYRIELEAIESFLARCAGVREAACRVQGEGAAEVIAAHLVPVDATQPPSLDDIKQYLRKVLPAYMVPAVFGLIADLPRSAGGKLRRGDLPVLTVARPAKARGQTPGSPIENAIARAMCEVFTLTDVSVADDFFDDLGGSSLQAAMLVSRLRADPLTKGIAVRDVYEMRTIQRLAGRATPPEPEPPAPLPPEPEGKPIAVTLAQSAWLLAELLVGAPIAYLVVFKLLPWLAGLIGLIPLVLIAPVVLFVFGLVWTPVSVLIAVRAKKILIGQYRPVNVTVWSGLYVRMWIVRHLMRFVPWSAFAGTEFQCVVLRRLGARIGRRVHIHGGVNLVQGGWDLLDIGDDVTLSQDSTLGLVQLSAGHVIVGPVTVGAGATVDVRAGLGPNTRMGRDTWLAPLSFLPSGGVIPDGERWDGVPAQPSGRTPRPPTPRTTGSLLSPIVWAVFMMFCRALLNFVVAVPASVSAIVLIAYYDLSYDALLVGLTHPLDNMGFLMTIAVVTCLTFVVTVWFEAFVARWLGTVREGVISRWSPAYVRIWLKSGLVTSAGNWLSGGLFWPVWLRWAGMRIGRGCEISTIIDVVPELVEIGPDTFFADGIYLGGPRIQRGTVLLRKVRLDHDTFLGNHAVIPAGQHLPPDVLVGICTTVDEHKVRQGSSWFGHPPFELPRREVVAYDRSLTHNPSFARLLTRVFWEWLRFALPFVPLVVVTAWTAALQVVADAVPYGVFLGIGAAVVTLGAALLPCLIVLALKWLLLGKVREGVHPLWSCWCSRWDFLYVAWGVIASGVLSAFEGTLLLPLYLRRMGMRIGKRVVLSEGFAQVVDPDMLIIEDGATVSAMFQAHTFEDRVLKIGHVRVGAYSTLADGTVPLYGADIGASTMVAPHSVIMKHERLLPGLRYSGVPTTRETDPFERSGHRTTRFTRISGRLDEPTESIQVTVQPVGHFGG
ncbi:non-ribosomal peptide synthetase [Actinocrispum wychmicini]|uniref:Non-ribosomal peptide synthetase-like protein n=1 Tax=Actinocrispum wychmicini TaxID=1213861 RepID=A0A4R2ISW0_9PSEU|nr:non-ribosomal peptide synthetase [Actinocrispum wychmicini]TCO47279.1 non-ribosomal peptide synthetase-like protein [Actinocrispum wychmicini]